MVAEQKTMAQFVYENKVTMESEKVLQNPNMIEDKKWPATHYRCEISCGTRRMTTYFSMGMAHTKAPDVESVLDCLASDASSVSHDETFEQWADNLGYDTDSRKAEKIYKACVKTARQLRRLMKTENLYCELLYQTERL